MKKCPGCEREIDKYGIVCDYCGKLEGEGDKVNGSTQSDKQSTGNSTQSSNNGN